MVVFVVLHIGGCLIEVFPAEMLFETVELLRYHRNPVLTNHDAIHLDRPDLAVPVVRSDILDRKPLVRLCLKNFLNEFFVAWTDKPWNQIVAGEDLFVQLVCVGIFEGQVAAGHCIQDDAGRPDITAKTMVSFSSNHFWCCVTRTATGCLQRLPWGVCIAQTKVDNLYVVLVVEKQVLWLQIPVADAAFMDVLNARDNLLEEFASLCFLEPFSLNDVLK